MPSGPPPREPQPGLGRAVRELREKAGLSRQTLAERADLPPSLLSRIEDGVLDPTWGDIRRLAEALGVSLETLAEAAEEYEHDGP